MTVTLTYQYEHFKPKRPMKNKIVKILVFALVNLALCLSYSEVFTTGVTAALRTTLALHIAAVILFPYHKTFSK